MIKLNLKKIRIFLLVFGFISCDSSDSDNSEVTTITPVRANIMEVIVTGEQDGSSKQDYCYDSDLGGPITAQCHSDIQINSNESYIFEFKFYSGDPNNRTDVTQEIINNHQNYFIFFTIVSGTERYNFEYFPESNGTIIGLKARIRDVGISNVFGPTISAGLIFSENLDKSNIPLTSQVDSNENVQFVSDLLSNGEVIARVNSTVPNYPN